MGSLIYLLKTKAKNWMLELFKSPFNLIIIAGTLFYFLATFFFGNTSQTAEKFLENKDIKIYFKTAVFIFFAVTAVLGIGKGLKEGASFFSMPDVNLLFNAPISPGFILVYGVGHQIATNLLTTFFLVFQIHFLKNVVGLDFKTIGILFLSWIVLLMGSQILSIYLYSIASRFLKWRKIIQVVFYALIGIVFGGAIFYLLLNKGEMTALLTYFNLPILKLIPIVGWSVAIIAFFMEGELLLSFVFLTLNLGVSGICLFQLLTGKADYFEDVLVATEKKQKTKTMIQEGRPNLAGDSSSNRIGKSHLLGKGNGEKVLFWRQITEQRRAGGTFLDKNSLVVIGIACILGIVFKSLLLSGKVEPFIVMILSITILGYLLFFLMAAGKFMQELSKPYIYLIPGSAFKKIYYASLPGVLKAFCEGLIAMVILAYIAKLPLWYPFLAGFLYTSLAQMFLSVNLLAIKIGGEKSSKLVETLIFIVASFLLMGPGLSLFAGLITLSYSLGSFWFLWAYLVAFFYNFCVSFLVFFAVRGVLKYKNR